MKPYTQKTLAELLTSKDETIWRNATSIYKRLRKLDEDGTLDAISETIEKEELCNCGMNAGFHYKQNNCKN